MSETVESEPPGIPPGAYPGSPDRPVSHDGFAGLSWLSRSELDWLIGRLPETGLFIEIGTASGVTAARISDALPRLDILCLDTFADSDDPAVAESEPGRMANWLRNQTPRMQLFVGGLGRLATMLGPSVRADAILVDGDHDLIPVVDDLMHAERLLAPGGAIYAHDCDEPSHPGVSRAVAAFCSDGRWAATGQHWTLRELRRR